MRLRRQLLLVSLLLISLPWAGCQYVREVEQALQTGQEQSLLASSGALAMILSDKTGTALSGHSPAGQWRHSRHPIR